MNRDEMEDLVEGEVVRLIAENKAQAERIAELEAKLEALEQTLLHKSSDLRDARFHHRKLREKYQALQAENQRLRGVTDDLHAACEQKQEIIDSDKCLAGELLALRVAAQGVVDDGPQTAMLLGCGVDSIEALSKALGEEPNNNEA